jgi:hypothetical protein
MKKILSILLFLHLLSYAISISILNSCFLDSSCKSQEYCEKDLLSPIGNCKRGDPDGAICLRSRTCESKKCEFFKCKKRINVKDGPCKTSSDCPEDQYCDDIPERDELRQCFDRKCIGACRKDSQCLSDKCHFFSCIRGESC